FDNAFQAGGEPLLTVPDAEVEGPGPDQAPPRPSLIGRAWAFDPESPRGLILLHRPNYLLPGRYTSRVNREPFTPLFEQVDQDQELESFEAKFQLSFKARLWAREDRNLGVWFAYTQQNQWQVFQSDLSSPFRDTNHTPELFASYRPGISLGGWDFNLLNFGYNHQSNGRSDPISRSWDRLFIEGGVERGGLALIGRAWYVLEDEDNPDITDFYGYAQLTAFYQRGENRFTVWGRGNVSEGRGAIEAAWSSRPVLGPLRAYVQVFHGYGESMLDYNWRQTTLGVGVTLNDFL
ncbi:MAG: phospholipase A, partial [Wenzhouxiangella sp.]